jgi:thymidylate synthase
MNNTDKFHDLEYFHLVDTVLSKGVQKGDRTGTGTISTFALQMRFDLTNNSLPLLTSKKMHTKSIIHELLWFLAGDTNIKYLNDNGVRIWNEWADENGDLGPVYGNQWRNWGGSKGEYFEKFGCTFYGEGGIGIDQIANVIDKLRTNPNDRRIIVSAWNVGQIEKMALPPCHAFFQFWSRELSVDERNDWMSHNYKGLVDYDCPISDDAKHEYCDRHGIPRRGLSCHLYQRSCDVALGVPFNIAQYSILIHMIAQVTNHIAEEFVWTGGDTHIYNNHIDLLGEQITREPYESPKLLLNTSVKEIDDFVFDDFQITEYESHPTIKMDVSV